MENSKVRLNDQVREFWEQGACGSTRLELQALTKLSPEWFEAMENLRYQQEPQIFSVAQFSRARGKRVLEIGVGAGTDHLQFARSGAICHGVDLTDEAIATTTARLNHYGFKSELKRLDSEALPFADASFDLVFSWGVIHHSEKPQAILSEVHRILKPGGEFRGMLYGLYSPHTFKMWVRFALLTGRPWRSFSDVIWHHVESIGTKAYSQRGVHQLFKDFRQVETTSIVTPYDTSHFPGWSHRFFPQGFGWFIGIHAIK